MPLAWAMGHLARLAAESGQHERAAKLLGFADAIYQSTGSTREPTEQLGYDRTLELVNERLAHREIEALMMQGAVMEQFTAVAEAVAIPRPGALSAESARGCRPANRRGAAPPGGAAVRAG